nr:MAG TPA_asm: hypothetical protein [Caudoviricetes sp.]
MSLMVQVCSASRSLLRGQIRSDRLNHQVSANEGCRQLHSEFLTRKRKRT